jgi:hypothetical protein
MIGKGKTFALNTPVHAGPDGGGVNKGVVGHEKQFFGYLNGQAAHSFRPLFEFGQIDAQDAVDDKIRGDGNMGAFVGHDESLQ